MAKNAVSQKLIEELEKETMQNCIVSFEGVAAALLPMNCSLWSTQAGFLRVSAEGKPDIYRLSSRKITTAIPQSLPEALRLAADLAEQSNGWSKKCWWMHLKSNSPNACYRQRGSYRQLCQSARPGPNYLFTWLRDNGILIATGERRTSPNKNTYPVGISPLKKPWLYKQRKQDFFHDSYNRQRSAGLMKRLLDAGVLVPVAATR